MHGSVSAYERANLTADADPRCRPVRLAKPAPQGESLVRPDYTPEEEAVWEELYARQRSLLPGRACDDFLRGLERMRFPSNRIPALRDVDLALESATGWRIARVPGLLHEEEFFAFLARGVFPSTDTLRPRHEMDYTPAPDLFHDVFGHTPMITEPTFARFYRRIGRAALAARGEDRRRIERFYWFTVEFGLIDTHEGLRVYGNGILSSPGELRHSLSSEVEKRAFDAATIGETEYDVWNLQPLLFVIESFDQLAEGFDRWAETLGGDLE